MLNKAGYVENLYTPECIRTYTGRYVNIFDPKPEMFDIEDIAHALSNIPRFGGHLPIWYSVADHCIGCVQTGLGYKPIELLMHDCSEAYMLDLPSPIKKNFRFYQEIEDNMMKVLSEKFGFEYPFDDKIKEIDKTELKFEWDNIMIGNHKPICTRQRSKKMFLGLYNDFKKK